MIYEKPAASLHIFSVQPSGGIYPSYTITGINNGVANEAGRAPRELSARAITKTLNSYHPASKAPSRLLTVGETEAGVSQPLPPALPLPGCQSWPLNKDGVRWC